MKQIIGYVKDYFVWVEKRVFFICSFITALAIFINYYHGLNDRIGGMEESRQYGAWYLVFLLVFSLGYAAVLAFRRQVAVDRRFLLLLLLAPAIFCWKMVFDLNLPLVSGDAENAYWNRVLYWPFKLLVISSAIFITWKLMKDGQPFYGLGARNPGFRPYLQMLLVMLPLVAAASTQADFLSTYPKMSGIYFLNAAGTGGHKLLFELSYGSDFFTIELFFRGFLVLAFCRWFGKDAILPMAMFYCTIHFGKPLGECISSFFGGIILGVVTFHTRSIYGGLLVHVGIAWMMELGGYLGNLAS